MIDPNWPLGKYIVGFVQGVPVRGYWTGRGIRVQSIEDGKRLDAWLSLGICVYYGRIQGKTVVQIGGEYLLD